MDSWNGVLTEFRTEFLIAYKMLILKAGIDFSSTTHAILSNSVFRRKIMIFYALFDKEGA
jgi:hypothetical protein